MGIPKHVLDHATRQGGYVTRQQLIDSGLSPGAIDRRVSQRIITLVSRGVYLVIPSENHVDLLRGATLALANAVVSHQSAAHLLRFPKLPTLIPTVVVPSHTTHRFPGVTVRRCDDLARSDIVQVDGLAVTNTTRTFFDLSRLLGFHEYDAIGEALVIAGRMELANFERITHRLARRGKSGSRAARDFLEIRNAPDRRATVLERRGRAVLSSAGLPAPIPQFPIPWDTRLRFDDAYPVERLAIEWDSRTWHQQRMAMGADRQRDRRAAAHGWVILRFTWDDVMANQDEIIDTVSTLLHDRRVAN